MKTTKKEFKDQIQEHIINSLSTDETEVLTEQLQNVVDEFKNWYSPYEQKLIPNRSSAFIDWMNGLPSCLSLEYTYYNIHLVLKSWFENCGSTYKEQSEDKESTLYMWLVYREFLTLCKKNGINF